MADTIFNSTDLRIDFSQYDRTLLDDMRERLLWQFSNSPVMDQTIQAFAIELQELYDSVTDTLQLRTLADARGVQLDVIGDIVGQDRILLNADERPWFGPDQVSANIEGVDQVGIWVKGADLTGDLPADDSQYLTLILSKIFKNHAQSGSIPELQVFARILTGYNISFQNYKDLDVEIIVSANMPGYLVETLVSVIDESKDADAKYLMPLAATTRLTAVIYAPVDDDGKIQAFTPDRESGRPDFAKAAIKVIL